MSLQRTLLCLILFSAASATAHAIPAIGLAGADDTVSQRLELRWFDYGTGIGDGFLLETGVAFSLPTRQTLAITPRYLHLGDQAGLRDFRINLAVPFADTGYRQSTFFLEGSLLTAEQARGVGSGHHEGAIGVASRIRQNEDNHLHVHARLGRWDVAATDQPGWRSVTGLRGGAMLNQSLNDSVSLLLAVDSGLSFSDDDLQDRLALGVSPGVRWRFNPRWALDLTAGVDLPGNGLAPRRRASLQISHQPATPPSPASLQQSIDAGRDDIRENRQRIEALEGAMGGYELLLSDREARIAELERQADGLNIELLNRSGVRRLGVQVAMMLESRGHRVVALHEEMVEQPPWRSHIRYRDGMAERAVSLGHSLPGIQIVTRADELDERADVRLLIGLDQLGGPAPGDQGSSD
ncbi:LytR C-terminal domain-containing protein [Natronospira bacteriovora]|uniref:LytR/CpsA/Psr regulator C-terminal domain-containing protein n=1 Tax=Natronospira bacteriovora TaxID=3069753 RepID=A0ABU0W7R5_9GAMM|nr:LytR C-terminal domain-containing protein [Natronospira sp. AB-CW4]MDQ2070083.1 hypothetical protein [Natronospira sp. AB-CW4]